MFEVVLKYFINFITHTLSDCLKIRIIIPSLSFWHHANCDLSKKFRENILGKDRSSVTCAPLLRVVTPLFFCT